MVKLVFVDENCPLSKKGPLTLIIHSLLKWSFIFGTPVWRINNAGWDGYKGCEDTIIVNAVLSSNWIFQWLISMMSRAIYSRWSRGHVCAGFCKSTLGTREFCEMAYQKSGNFILEFWWDPWTKLSYIEMVVMTPNMISPGIVINHVDRSFHGLIVTTGDISMIPSFEIWSYMLLELLLLSC